MKLQKKSIFVFLILAFLALAVTFFFSKKSAWNAPNGNPSTFISTENKETSNAVSSSGSSFDIGNHYEITKQDKLSYNFLKENAKVVKQIQKLIDKFKISNMATSAPVSIAKLTNGKEILLLWGCTPNNCGGTTIVIALDQENNKLYALSEKVSLGQNYEILGDPHKEIKDLLIYYYLHQ